MGRIVVKFGGSNLKSAGDIARLIAAVQAYNRPLVIVVSALYGVTNILKETVEGVVEDKSLIFRLKSWLLEEHKKILFSYINHSIIRQECLFNIRGRLDELEKFLFGIHLLEEVPPAAEDRVLSYGERLSSLLLAAILNYKDIECEEVLPEDIGLYTDGIHGNATVDYEVSRQRLRRSLKADSTYIIPGFYGIGDHGKVTLLGRGGSDYSAAAVGLCIDAETVDVWKDVEGFMSADPKKISGARAIERLSYLEAAELSYFGAGILHPRTFEPLMEQDIPVRLFNITGFDGRLKPVSIVSGREHPTDGIVKSVTWTDDVGILQLKGSGVGIKPGIMADVAGHLNQCRINIKSILTAQTAINILLSRRDTERAAEVILRRGIAAVEDVDCIDNISLVAVVGDGILDQPGIAARVFGAVSRQHINIRIICFGASDVAAYFIIPSGDCIEAAVAIHREFFNENN